jgi:transcriptional regulator GlxA family with amidase domain
LNLDTTSAASWLQFVSVLGRETDPTQGLFRHPLATQTLQNLIIQSLLLMHPHNYTDALSENACTAPPGTAQHAMELMRAHPEIPWTTVKLAQATGVSARALQKSFARCEEPPPMTYLRHLRLHRAHSELLNADPRTITVTSVAGRWGFLHFGRFAQQYCQMFGEYPSATLSGPNGRV